MNTPYYSCCVLNPALERRHYVSFIPKNNIATSTLRTYINRKNFPLAGTVEEEMLWNWSSLEIIQPRYLKEALKLPGSVSTFVAKPSIYIENKKEY